MKLKHSFSLAFAALSLLSPASARGETVAMLQNGKQTVTVDEPITLTDWYGGAGMSSSSSNSSMAATVFKPADAGKVIQITFTDLMIMNDGNSYPGYIKLYNEEFDADGSFTYYNNESSEQSYNSDANLIDRLECSSTSDTQYNGKSYFSTASDGTLSLFWHWRYAKGNTRMIATVEQISADDMTLTGVAVDYSAVPTTIRQGQTVTLGQVNVTAEGIFNAPNVTGVDFTLSNTAVYDPQALTITVGGTAASATITSTGANAYHAELSAPVNGTACAVALQGTVLSDAPFFDTCTTTITGISFDAASSPNLTLDVAPEQTVAAVVLLSTEDQTVTVPEAGIMLYDDGGPDGNVSGYFKGGALTLLPGDPSKKVMINFTTLDLFLSSYYSQTIYIYNGTTATDANLIATVNKDSGTPFLVRSTSDDGALTVKMTCDYYGSSYSGFEAVVSLFTPQAMTISDIAVSDAGTSTACASTAAVPMVMVDIITENTEPALLLESITVKSVGSEGRAVSASVYFTGASAEWPSSPVALGTATFSGNQATITLDTPATMSEGHNYAWITFEVDANAVNNETLDCEVTAVNGTAVSNGNPDGVVTIYNQILSAIGTYEYTVIGEWGFRNTPISSSYDSYRTDAGDQITIMHPGTANHILQLDLSEKFYLYMQSWYNEDSQQPIFQVYSGSGTSGELLWQCSRNTNYDQRTTGPGEVLRSTAADGSLTVVFNTHGTGSNYSSTYGFKGTVSEYMPSVQTLEGITVAQASTAVIPCSAGATDQELITFDIQTAGLLSPLALQQAVVDLKGCQSALQAVKLYQGSTLLATSEVTESSEVTLALTNPLSLGEGSNVFTVSVDMQPVVASGLEIDAKLISVTLSDQVETVAEGDPDGSRPTMNIYLLQPTDDQQVTIGDESLLFYDEGGADGKPTGTSTGTVTFTPATDGCCVQLEISQIALTYYDNLEIYYGSEATGTAAYTWDYYSLPEVGAIIKSLADNGAITVKYTSKSSTTIGDGWEIIVSQSRLEPLSVSATATEAQPVGKALGGSTSVTHQIAITVAGDKGSMTVDEIILSLSGSDNLTDIASIEVIPSGTATTLSTSAEPYASVTALASETVTLTGDYEITLPGTYYFWVRVTVAQDAAVGDNVMINPASVTLSGATTALEAATVTIPVVDGMHGTYRIGSSSEADYATFTDAVADLAIGMNGPVVFEVEPGDYIERITIADVPGISETNTLTFRSTTGKYADVVLEHNSYSSGAYGSDYYGVVTIDGTPYVTFDGITISTTDVNYNAVVYLLNASHHFSLLNSKLYAPENEGSTTTVQLLRVKQVSGDDSQLNHHITVDNSVIDGGLSGLYIGSGYTTTAPEEGDVIRGNIFRNQGSQAIYASFVRDIVIDGNYIENTVTTKSGFAGIALQPYDAFTVTNNVVYLAAQNYVYGGISFRKHYLTDDSSTEFVGLVANNEILVVPYGTSASYALQQNYAISNTRIAHNTFRILNSSSTGTSHAAYWFNDANTNVLLENNIFQNEHGSYAVRVNQASYITGATMRDNVLGTTGTNIAYFGGGITYDEWVTKTGWEDDTNAQVSFLGDDYSMPTTLSGIDTACSPLDYVTTDLDGRARSSSAATPGAYEYLSPLPLPAYLDGYPEVAALSESTATLDVRVDAHGKIQLLVVDGDAATPSLAEVQEGTITSTLRPNMANLVDLTGLQQESSYKVYAILYSADGLLMSDAPALVAQLGTVAEYLPLELTVESVTADQGDQVTLTPILTDGTGEAPYTYLWTDAFGATLTMDEDLSLTANELGVYTVTVTDARLNSVSATAVVKVNGDFATADFDNATLDESSHFTGEQEGTPWNSGSILFTVNQYKNNWNGVALANETATDYDSIAHQWRNAAGGAHSGDNYAVYYPSQSADDTFIEITNSDAGATLSGVYVTNSAYSFDSMSYGDLFGVKEFDEGDYFSVTFTGYDAQGATGSVSFDLADYTTSVEADRYILDTWEWVDLRDLGPVTSLRISFAGSQSNSYGMILPTYLCLDDLGGSRDEEDGGVITLGVGDSTVDFADIFGTPASDGATTTYGFPDGMINTNGVKTTWDGMSASFEVTIDSETSEAPVVVSQTRKGHTRYALVTLSGDDSSSIDSIDIDSVGDSARYYNLQGQRILRPAKGQMLIRVVNGSSQKILY
ncbi:MAG: DUF4465 domain-containing protein [Bacteroidales bacterium]|nr:DUF4465 domain-containing protein [Bacteroidales bacterium]